MSSWLRQTLAFLRDGAGILGNCRRWLAVRRRSFRFWLLLVVGLIVLLVAYYVVADRYTPLTTDAFVQAYVVQVAPQVGGQVVRVCVHEGDQVHAGDLLFELDPRPFQHRVDMLRAKLIESQYQIKQLEAQRAAAQAEQRQWAAEAEYARAVHQQEEEIYKKASTTERKYLDAVQKLKASEAALERSGNLVESVEQQLAARVGPEHAVVAQVQAQLAEAELNLGYTQVHAPCDGMITNLQLSQGAYADVGQAVLTCIDTRHWLIVANFRERCLEKMRPGQPALVAFAALPGKLWPAEVASLGSGVGQGQGIPSGMLPDVKNQSAWLPVAQRFQVRLALDGEDRPELRVGMTASVSVYVEETRVLGGVTDAVHTIIAWLYYL